jgi:hypothetical protein
MSEDKQTNVRIVSVCLWDLWGEEGLAQGGNESGAATVGANRHTHSEQEDEGMAAAPRKVITSTNLNEAVVLLSIGHAAPPSFLYA